MGGRGSSSGIAENGKRYGTEFRTLYEHVNIKFVQSTGENAKPPLETMTRGRVYVVVNQKSDLKSIVYYDKHNKKYRQVDIHGHTHKVNGKNILEHTHRGYYHDEKGTMLPRQKETKMIERVRAVWYNRQSRE